MIRTICASTTANKLHLEGFAENKVGAKTPAGSISKWGRRFTRQYKKIYTARQPLNERRVLSGERDLDDLGENHFLTV